MMNNSGDFLCDSVLASEVPDVPGTSSRTPGEAVTSGNRLFGCFSAGGTSPGRLFRTPGTAGVRQLLGHWATRYIFLHILYSNYSARLYRHEITIYHYFSVRAALAPRSSVKLRTNILVVGRGWVQLLDDVFCISYDVSWIISQKPTNCCAPRKHATLSNIKECLDNGTWCRKRFMFCFMNIWTFLSWLDLLRYVNLGTRFPTTAMHGTNCF